MSKSARDSSIRIWPQTEMYRKESISKCNRHPRVLQTYEAETPSLEDVDVPVSEESSSSSMPSIRTTISDSVLGDLDQEVLAMLAPFGLWEPISSALAVVAAAAVSNDSRWIGSTCAKLVSGVVPVASAVEGDAVNDGAPSLFCQSSSWDMSR